MQLPGDESLDHLNGTVRLGARVHNPAMLGAWVDLVVDLAASRPVCRNEVLLHGGELATLAAAGATGVPEAGLT